MFENTLYTLGAVPFILLGALHTVYSLIDDRKPFRIVPRDKKLIAAMKGSPLVISNKTTVWKAWIGFNLSHGIGILMFGGLYFYLSGFHYQAFMTLGPVPVLAPVIAAIYFLLAVRYWFAIPAAGSAIGCVLFILGLGL